MARKTKKTKAKAKKAKKAQAPPNPDKLRIESIHRDKGFSVKIIKIAREAGFTFEQIDKFTDEEALKLFVIRAKPGLAARFIEKPEKPQASKSEPCLEDEVVAFDVGVLAGTGPMRQRVVNEQRDIDIQIRQRNIHNITSITIKRMMKPDDHNKVHSTVTIEYEKEK